MKLLTTLLCLICPFILSAVDFRLTGIDGTEFTLKPDSKPTILFLYNSECDACSRAAQRLISSDTIKSASPRIAAIAVFENDDNWKKKASLWPESWIVGADSRGEVVDSDSLTFESVPAFILLDENLNVRHSTISLNDLQRFMTEKK